MSSVLDDDPIKGILKGNVDTIKIDVHASPPLARKYRIGGTPTILFLNVQGKELLRVPGAMTKEDFGDLLCKYVVQCKTISRMPSKN